MVHTLILSTPSGRIYEQPLSSHQRSPVLLQVECFSPTPSKPTVTCVCVIGPREVALADSKGAVYVLSLDQNRYRRLCTGITACQSLLPLPTDSLAIATQKDAKVYQLNGQLLTTLRGHKDKIDSCDVNYLRKWLLTQSQDTVIIWEIAGWRRVRTVNTEAAKYVLCRFTPDSQSMMVNLKDGSVYQMGLAKFTTEKEYKSTDGVKMFAINGSFTRVYGVTQGGVLIWDCKTPQSPVSFLPFPPGVATVTQFSLINDTHLVMLSDSGIVYVVSVETDKAIGEIRSEGGIVGFAGGKAGFCTRAVDGSVTVLDWETRLAAMLCRTQDHTALERRFFDVPSPVSADAPPQRSNPSSSDHSVVILRKDGLDFNNLSTSSVSTLPAQPCQHQLFVELFHTAKLDPEQSRLQHCNLRRLLQYTGEYPERYRVFVWRFLLQLPNNKEAFEGLYSKGMHPALVNLHQNPLLKPASLYAKLERVISALTYWSPIFGEADFVPVLLHPLATVCRGDDLTFFELVVALFLNWLQHWLEFYPTPPLNYLQSIDNLVKYHEPTLHRHFQALKCPPKAYIWPSLRYLFAQFLGFDGVVRLLDFIFTDWDKPQLLLFISAAIVIKYKNRLLKMTKSSEISVFFTTFRPVKLPKIMEIAFSLFNETPSDVSIVGFDQHLPISPSQYPLFTGYPKFIVEERQGIRDTILADEERLIKQESTVGELVGQMEELREKERGYGVKREQIAQLDKEWRSMAQVEEQLRAQERLAFEKETSVKKQEEIREMESRFAEQTAKMTLARTQELQMLEQEVSRGAVHAQYATEAKIADEALRAMEQRAAKAIAETIEKRTVEELQRREALVGAEHKEQAALKDRLTQAQWQREDESQLLRLQLQREREQQQLSTRHLTEATESLTKAQQLQSLEHELKLLEVAKERRLRQIAEEELERGRAVATLQAKKRDILAAEESHHFADLKRREEFHEKRLAEERQTTLQSITLQSQKELWSQQDEIQRLDREKQRKEAEGRLIELRKDSEQRAIDAERQFHEEILELDAASREKRQTNLEKLFSQKEEEEKLYFQRVIQNEKASLERMSTVEKEGRLQQAELIEEQKRRTQRAQEELAKAHRERIQKENEVERMRMVQEKMRGGEVTKKLEGGRGGEGWGEGRRGEGGRREDRGSDLSEESKSSSSSVVEPSQTHSRRAVTFHSTYTSPEFTNRLTSPEYSAHEHGSECSCSCHSGSGTSTPPLPTRSVREEDDSDLSDGSELILSHSGSSFASKYSSQSNSRR